MGEVTPFNRNQRPAQQAAAPVPDEQLTEKDRIRRRIRELGSKVPQAFSGWSFNESAAFKKVLLSAQKAEQSPGSTLLKLQETCRALERYYP